METPETILEAEEVKERKKPSNLWKPGQSGNPAGRPLGSRNRTSIVREMVEQNLTEILATDAESLLKTATDLAKAGDTSMLKLLLERLIPLRGASEDLKKRTPPTITINVGRTAEKLAPGAVVIDGESQLIEDVNNGER